MGRAGDNLSCDGCGRDRCEFDSLYIDYNCCSSCAPDGFEEDLQRYRELRQEVRRAVLYSEKFRNIVEEALFKKQGIRDLKEKWGFK